MKETYRALLTFTDNPAISEKIENEGNIVGNLKIDTAIGYCAFETVEYKNGDKTRSYSDLILIEDCSEIQIDEDKIECTNDNGMWLFELIK